MTPFFTLLREFILRGLWREKARTVVTFVGITLGVAVGVAIRLANESALESFKVGTEAVAGETSLEIVSRSGRFDELLLRDLLWLREYGQPSPVVEGLALLRKDDSAAGFLHVLGVDMLADRPMRDYRLLKLTADAEETSGREFLDLLSTPRSIIVTEKLARRRQLDIGDTLEVVIGDTPVELTIRGLLLDSGPARTLDGSFALMDIAFAQDLFAESGVLDRIDVKIHDGQSIDAAREGIDARLPAPLHVRAPEERFRQVETMIASFHFNLSALGSLALLVGLFLVYNTVSFSVVRRRAEISRLRACGANRSLIFALFIGEAVIVAFPAAIIGAVIGEQLAAGAVKATAGTVNTFYIAQTARESADALALGIDGILTVLAITLVLAIAAAAVPAHEATRIRPFEEPASTGRSLGARHNLRDGVLACVFLALAWGLSELPAVGDLPLGGYGAVIALIVAATLLTPLLVSRVCELADSWIFSRSSWTTCESLLASRNLGATSRRVSISIAALSVSLAMTISIAIMIGSFRETVVYWLGQTMQADIYVRPLSLTSSLGKGRLSPESVNAMSDHPRVAEAESIYRSSVEYEGRLLTVGARSFDVLENRGGLQFMSGDPKSKDRALVSESFYHRFGKGVGDKVELPTDEGPAEFTIGGVFYDYSNNQGVVMLDVATFRRRFGTSEPSPSDLALYLLPGGDAHEVVADLESRMGDRRVVLKTSSDVREASMEIFDSTFAITYALELVAVLIAGLGVISTLATLLLERRREIQLLRLIGSTARQIRKVMVLEAILVGATGQLLGIVLGISLSLVLIYVINVQSFGWSIQLRIDPLFLGQTSLFTLIAAVVAGWFPARQAAKPGIFP